MRIVVSGGGTAGHISPILATVDALKSHDKSVEILYVGQKTGMERQFAKGAGLHFAGIAAGKYRRIPQASLIAKLSDLESIRLNLRDSGRLAKGVAQSLKILRRFKPDAVFIKGGFVGLPVGIAAAILRIPFVIHESDVEPGLTNKILARWASHIAVGFPKAVYHTWSDRKMIYTGNPVAKEIMRAHRLEGLAHFHLDEEPPTALIMGGSLGARAINDAVAQDIADLVTHFQVIHIAGEHDFSRVQVEVSKKQLPAADRYHLKAFLPYHELAMAYAVSEMVVSRAGANSVAELAALGKPTILIPNRLMAAHQLLNARTLSRAGAVRVLPEEKLSPGALCRELVNIADSEEERANLGAKLKQFNVIDADERLAGLILETASHR